MPSKNSREYDKAMAYLRALPKRPRGEEVDRLARKWGVARATAYRRVKTVFGPDDGGDDSPSPEPPAPREAPEPTLDGEHPEGEGHPTHSTPFDEWTPDVEPVQPSLGGVDDSIDPEQAPDFTSGYHSPQQGPGGGGPASPGAFGGGHSPHGPRPHGQSPPPSATPHLEVRPLVDLICGLLDPRFEDPLAEGVMADGGELKPPGAITEKERQALAQAWGPRVEKWLPILAPYMVEINCLIVTTAIFLPRILGVVRYQRAHGERGVHHEPLDVEEEVPEPTREDLYDFSAARSREDVGRAFVNQLGGL